MKEKKFVREGEVSNEQFFIEFSHLLTSVDYIIYNISHEDDDSDN